MAEGTSRRWLLRTLGVATATVWGVSGRVVDGSDEARDARPERSGVVDGTGSGLDSTSTPTPQPSTEAPTTTPTPSNEPPTARFTYSPAEPEAGESIEFDASASSDPDGSILAYAWDFDDDGTVDATGETVTHTYEEPGEYTLVMGVADDDRETDRTTETIEVVPAETETSGPTRAPTTDTPTETASPTPTEPPTPTTTPTPTADGLLDGSLPGVGTVIGGGITLVAGVVAAKKFVGGGDSGATTPGSTGPVHTRAACPTCGRSLGGDEKYCTGCGYELMDQRCPACEADLDGDEKFCIQCGQDLSN